MRVNALPVSDCIARVDADSVNIAWCGKRGATPFFVDIDHVVYQVKNMKRPHPVCMSCVLQIIAVLRDATRTVVKQ